MGLWTNMVVLFAIGLVFSAVLVEFAFQTQRPISSRMAFQLVQYPLVGFRVEVCDPGSPSNNDTTTWDGGIKPRDAMRPLDAASFRNHLNWGCRRPGPLISFTRSWARAMRRCQLLINQGARDVVVIAAWLQGLPLHDAVDVAIELGFGSEDVNNHTDEVLLHGRVYGEDYRILATFRGRRPAETVQLALPKITLSLEAPPGPVGRRVSFDQRLKLEIYSHTGVLNIAKYYHPALATGNQSYTVGDDGVFKLHFP